MTIPLDPLNLLTNAYNNRDVESEDFFLENLRNDTPDIDGSE